MPEYKGRAERASNAAFARAAEALGVEVAVIRAIWEVESAGKPYRVDGSLTRRFEPHHMPGAKTNWRDSLNMTGSQRENAFNSAWSKNKEATARATSWGGPQSPFGTHRYQFYVSALDTTLDLPDNTKPKELIAALTPHIISQAMLTGKFSVLDILRRD